MTHDKLVSRYAIDGSKLSLWKRSQSKLFISKLELEISRIQLTWSSLEVETEWMFEELVPKLVEVEGKRHRKKGPVEVDVEG